MNSSAISNVHLTTASLPSIRVQRHRSSKTTGSRNDTSSVTNKFLKKGGCLPSVLPESDRKAKNLSYDFLQDERRRRLPTRVSRHMVPQIKLMNSDQDQPMAKPFNNCDIEKRLEQLSCEVLKFQSVLQNHKINDAAPRKKEDDNESFSARDYACLMLEVNGRLSAQLYDPSEFSEKESIQKRRTRNQHSNNYTYETLLSLQKELMNWRAEQSSDSRKDFNL